MKKRLFLTISFLSIFFLAAAPTFAYGWDFEWNGWGDEDEGSGVVVENENSAYVVNNVTAISNTGRNVSTGGDVDADAGDGGDVDDADEDNEGGEGGDVGNAGDGGSITTGDAIATADVLNEINYNEVCVEDLDNDSDEPDEYSYDEEYEEEYSKSVEEDDDEYESEIEESSEGSISEYWRKYPVKAPRIVNRNEVEVVNNVYAEALTGDNVSTGGDMEGDAGSGGDVEDSAEDNEGGDGGSLGDAGWGGEISTGVADSLSRIVNRINRSITTVRF